MKHEDLGWLAAERQSRNHSPQLGRWGTASWAFTSRYPLGSEGSQEAPGAWLWRTGRSWPEREMGVGRRSLSA